MLGLARRQLGDLVEVPRIVVEDSLDFLPKYIEIRWRTVLG